MPSLRFANLGPTLGTAEVSASGNLYVLMTEDSNTAIVFDLRRYATNPPNDKHELKFKRIVKRGGHFEVPIIPESRLKSDEQIERESKQLSFRTAFENAHNAYVVNLTGQPSTDLGWQHLEWLFPKTRIFQIPLGRTDWRSVTEEEIERNLIHSVESTDLVDRGKKVEVGPYKLFLFRTKPTGEPAGILITGQTRGNLFAFFFGNESFREFFPNDRVEAGPIKLHTLSGGTWHSFYETPLAPSCPLCASPPVEELVEHT